LIEKEKEEKKKEKFVFYVQKKIFAW